MKSMLDISSADLKRIRTTEGYRTENELAEFIGLSQYQVEAFRNSPFRKNKTVWWGPLSVWESDLPRGAVSDDDLLDWYRHLATPEGWTERAVLEMLLKEQARANETDAEQLARLHPQLLPLLRKK